MNEWINKQTNEWTNERMNEWINKQTNKRMNEWMNDSMNEWMAWTTVVHDLFTQKFVNPRRKASRGHHAMAYANTYKNMSINMLIMQIIQIRSFVCLSPTRTCRPLADWLISTIVLAAVSGRSAAGPRGPRVSQMLPPRANLTHVNCMLAAGAHPWRPQTCILEWRLNRIFRFVGLTTLRQC